jgi:inorganic triphosphatase YgiF
MQPFRTLFVALVALIPLAALAGSPSPAEPAEVVPLPEYEAKLDVGSPEAVLRELAGLDRIEELSVRYAGPRRCLDAYMDDPEGRILASGGLLRLRSRYDGRTALQSKDAGVWSGRQLLRTEAAEEVAPREALDLARGTGLASHPIVQELAGRIPGLDSAALRPVLVVDDERHTFFVGPAEEPERYLLTLDIGEFRRPGAVNGVPFAELEVEVIGEDTPTTRARLDAFVAVLAERHDLQRSPGSKYQRGMAAVQGRP